jgi:hypothetical protein
MLQWPEIFEQLLLDVQIVPVWMLQWPAWTQSVFCWQVVPVWMLQWPPARRHCAFEVQLVPLMLHVPTCGQALLVRQLWPPTLQVPGSVGQLALDVQLTAGWRLQVPGLGVHTGGAQLLVPVQGFSGSGGSRLQPGGL